MRPEMCIICRDPHKFSMHLYDVERINHYLKIYTRQTPIEDTDLYNNIRHDSKHIHVMCGRCPKISTNKLKTEEEILHKNIYYICKQIEAGEELPVQDILRLLQGHYPILWKVVNNARRKKSND